MHGMEDYSQFGDRFRSWEIYSSVNAGYHLVHCDSFLSTWLLVFIITDGVHGVLICNSNETLLKSVLVVT